MIPILSDRSGSQRWSTKDVLFLLLMVLVTLASGQEDYSQTDLEAMTEVELENICVQRGFKLVNENSDELTKQDYVEAAQRCLSIEQEMNELLTQYPELAEELEEEIKRMESENAEKLADVERLQSEIANDSADDSQSDLDAAFVPRGIDRENENEPALDDDAQSYSTMGLNNTQLEDSIEDTDPATNLERIEPPRKEDLTLTHIAVESFRVLVKNAQDDVRRIINLAIPVLQPLFNVGDVAWRQMKDFFDRARKAYEAYQATNIPSDEATETPETCDDTVYS